MARNCRWFGVWILMLSLAASLGAWAQEQPAKPKTAPLGIDPIMAYAGVWKIETDHLDTPYSKASHDSSTVKNACWKSGGYIVCNQFVNGQSSVLLIYTFVEKENSYRTYQVPHGGGEPGSGTLFIDGNTFEYPWKVTSPDHAMYFRVVNVFTSPDQIEYRQEFSADKQHWVVMAKGTEKKVAAE
jgi:hypothetical protein